MSGFTFKYLFFHNNFHYLIHCTVTTHYIIPYCQSNNFIRDDHRGIFCQRGLENDPKSSLDSMICTTVLSSRWESDLLTFWIKFWIFPMFSIEVLLLASKSMKKMTKCWQCILFVLFYLILLFLFEMRLTQFVFTISGLKMIHSFSSNQSSSNLLKIIKGKPSNCYSFFDIIFSVNYSLFQFLKSHL